MPLPASRELLLFMGTARLREAITRRRTIIRWHRDQIGSKRCWLNDFYLFALVDGLESALPTPPLNQAMVRCIAFYENCNTESAPTQPPDALLNPTIWNDDLEHADKEMLLNTLAKMQWSIVSLYNISDRPRTWEDYERLYRLLPERIEADFRLGPRDAFLQGDGMPPGTGCLAFWQSHSRCPQEYCTAHHKDPHK